MEEVFRPSIGRRRLLNYFSNVFAFAGISAAFCAGSALFSFQNNLKEVVRFDVVNPTSIVDQNFGVNQFYVREVKVPDVKMVAIAKPSSKFYDNTSNLMIFAEEQVHSEIQILSAIAEKRNQITFDHEGYDPQVIVMSEGLTEEVKAPEIIAVAAVTKEYPNQVEPKIEYSKKEYSNKVAIDAIAALLKESKEEIKSVSHKRTFKHKRAPSKPIITAVVSVNDTPKVVETIQKPVQDAPIYYSTKEPNTNLTTLYESHIEKLSNAPVSTEYSNGDYSAVYKPIQKEAPKESVTPVVTQVIQTSQPTQTPAPIITVSVPAQAPAAVNSGVSKSSVPEITENKSKKEFEDAIQKVQREWNSTHGGFNDEVTTKKVCTGFSGKVLTGLTGGQSAIAEAKIQVLGSENIYTTDFEGSFCITDIKISSVLPVVVSAPTYLNRSIELVDGVPATIELLQENALPMSARFTGEQTASGNAYLFGEIINSEKTDMSFQVEVIEVTTGLSKKIIYVDEKGFPNSALRYTSSKQQFVLQNATPGTYAVTVIGSDGVERAPHILHLSANEGVIKKFDTGEKTLVEGKLIDSLSLKPKSGYNVQILGQSKVVKSRADGKFKIHAYIDCREPTYLQAEAQAIYRTRFNYGCATAVQEYYVVSSLKIDEISRQAEIPLVQTHGMILGKLNYNRRMKVQLIGAEELKMSSEPRGYDVYFDADGGVSRTLTHTSENERFSIIDAPAGLSYLMAFDKDGTVFYQPTLITPSTINVY